MILLTEKKRAELIKNIRLQVEQENHQKQQLNLPKYRIKKSFNIEKNSFEYLLQQKNSSFGGSLFTVWGYESEYTTIYKSQIKHNCEVRLKSLLTIEQAA